MPENEPLDLATVDNTGMVQRRKFLSTTDQVFLILFVVSCLGNMVGPITMEAIFMNQNSYRNQWKEFPGSILTGLLLSEFSVLAYWAMSSLRAIHNRSVVVFVTGLILAICLIIGCYAWSGMPIAFAVMVICIGGSFGFINWWLLVLWDRLFRLRVVASDAILQASSSKRQFGIGYLLGWMAVVAVGIVIIKQILPKNNDPWMTGTLDLIGLSTWFVWLIIGVSTVSLFTRNAILGCHPHTVVIAILLLLFGPLVFQTISSTLFSMLGMWLTFAIDFYHLAMAYCVEAGIVVGCTLGAFSMRTQGYRLVGALTQ